MQWAVPLLLVALLWLLLLAPATRQYVTALTRSLRLRRLDLDAEPLNLSDDSSVRVIRASLRSEDDGRVVHALSLLLQIPDIDWNADLVPLAAHESAQIRHFALRRLASLGGDLSGGHCTAGSRRLPRRRGTSNPSRCRTRCIAPGRSVKSATCRISFSYVIGRSFAEGAAGGCPSDSALGRVVHGAILDSPAARRKP